MILDGHKTCYWPHICQEAKNVKLLSPPHSTHLSQPLDMCAQAIIKGMSTQMLQSRVQITKYNFVRLLKGRGRMLCFQAIFAQA